MGERRTCKKCGKSKPVGSFEWAEKNRTRRWVCRRCRWLKQSYSLSEAEFEQMMVAQAGMCAICCVPMSRAPEGRGACVDHSHGTGGIRAVLCHLCNTGIGKFRDSALLLRAAAEYIERFTDVPPANDNAEK